MCYNDVHVHVHKCMITYSEEQYERLEKLYKRKCAVPHIGEQQKLQIISA